MVTEHFGFAEMNILAFEDLYSGKLHAALDRQHPRDLFDVMILPKICLSSVTFVVLPDKLWLAG